MRFPEVVRTARQCIRNRIENGFPFEDFETAETIALEMIEQSKPFPGTPVERVKRAVRLALRFEGHALPDR